MIGIVWDRENVRTREEKTTDVQLNNSINIKDTMGPFKRQYQNVLLFCSILKSIVWIRFISAHKRCMSDPHSASAVSDNSGHTSVYNSAYFSAKHSFKIKSHQWPFKTFIYVCNKVVACYQNMFSFCMDDPQNCSFDLMWLANHLYRSFISSQNTQVKM